MTPASTPDVPAARRVGASFRDPAGFVFQREGRLLRHVSPGYTPHYRALKESGLYDSLVEKGWLVPHEERTPEARDRPAAYLLEPERLPFISHPYEWSFSMLRDAALLTLDIQLDCLSRGLTLKDASAYNIQFHRARPVLIDTLSFERTEPGEPWVAYRQFCQHFLAPLALAAKADHRLSSLSRLHLDGIPLDLASRLLPWRTWCSLGLATHLHLHARSLQRRAAGDAGDLEQEARMARVRAGGVRAIVQNLRDTVAALEWRAASSTWSEYYATAAHYGADGVEQKAQQVEALLQQEPPGMVWDLGANTGHFSAIAARHHRTVVSWDFDALCVERMYLRQRQEASSRATLPLVLDLANPSPAQGWSQAERAGLLERGPADVVLALGLMHHLVLSGQVPLDELAQFFGRIARSVIIEFVPLHDPQAALLASRLRGRGHVYDAVGFEAAFGEQFHLQSRQAVAGTDRVLYHFRAR